jgi:hypothetical protein
MPPTTHTQKTYWQNVLSSTFVYSRWVFGSMIVGLLVLVAFAVLTEFPFLDRWVSAVVACGLAIIVVVGSYYLLNQFWEAIHWRWNVSGPVASPPDFLYERTRRLDTPFVAAALSPSLPSTFLRFWFASDELDLQTPKQIANVPPSKTGLPFVVWIFSRGTRSGDVFVVKISRPPSMLSSKTLSITVSITEPIVMPEDHTDFDLLDLSKVRQWIELNRDALLRYWRGDIEYTEDALNELRSI